jgi:hypothetical protein
MYICVKIQAGVQRNEKLVDELIGAVLQRRLLQQKNEFSLCKNNLIKHFLCGDMLYRSLKLRVTVPSIKVWSQF